MPVISILNIEPNCFKKVKHVLEEILMQKGAQVTWRSWEPKEGEKQEEELTVSRSLSVELDWIETSKVFYDLQARQNEMKEVEESVDVDQVLEIGLNSNVIKIIDMSSTEISIIKQVIPSLQQCKEADIENGLILHFEDSKSQAIALNYLLNKVSITCFSFLQVFLVDLSSPLTLQEIAGCMGRLEGKHLENLNVKRAMIHHQTNGEDGLSEPTKKVKKNKSEEENQNSNIIKSSSVDPLQITEYILFALLLSLLVVLQKTGRLL